MPKALHVPLGLPIVTPVALLLGPASWGLGTPMALAFGNPLDRFAITATAFTGDAIAVFVAGG